MKKLAVIPISLLVLLVSIGSSIFAQTPPQVEVVLSKTTAAQNETISADVYVRTVLTIVGADIGIDVDSPCLKVEGRENGHYLPTKAEDNGFIPFEKTTDTGTRLAASVLGQKTVADPDQYFFRATLRVGCANGSANVKVTFAQLVDKQLTSYKLETGQVTPINALLTISGTAAPSAPANTQVSSPNITQPAVTMQPTQPAAPGGESTGSIDFRIVFLVGVALVVLLIAIVAIKPRFHNK